MQKSEYKQIKVNGFSKTPNILQLISYYVFFNDLILFIILVMPFYDQKEGVIKLKYLRMNKKYKFFK